MPYGSAPYGVPVRPVQTYFNPDDLNWNARPVPAVPVISPGNRINLEHMICGTVYVTVAAGGGANVVVQLACYDLDDATILVTAALGFGVVGSTSALDFGTGAASLLRGRVFRVHDLGAQRAGVGGADPVVTMRLYMRS